MDASMLLAGPRGRRMLLWFALEANDADDGALHERVFAADYLLDLHPPTLLTMTADGTELPEDASEIYSYMPAPDVEFVQRERASAPDPDAVSAAVERVVAALDSTALPEVSGEALAAALADAVSVARYWQPADGTDVLLAREELKDPLARVAERVAASPHADWWASPVAERSQHAMLWDGEDPVPPVDSSRTQLIELRRHLEEREKTARDEKWAGKVSAEWWSAPSWPITGPRTARLLPDGSPVGALLVEDDFGWEEGESIELEVPGGLRIFEIDGADAWVDLCRRFPIEVTEQKRGDWRRTTERDGPWVMPDWAAVAEEYDAVHLQVAAYLQAAGRALPVTDEAATVLAGWDPDATYWFTDRVRYVGERTRWVMNDDDKRIRWERDSG
ncbi:MAG: hypothetical protein ACTJHB_04335 [Microbacterium gubbeenense]|uniref:hypothetical protein n=1 Tax=Microbacterium gubbeenense TaxID=159896 RepID=UPI003F995648